MSGFRIKESFTVKGGEGQLGSIGDREFGIGMGEEVRVLVEREGGGELVSGERGGGCTTCRRGRKGLLLPRGQSCCCSRVVVAAAKA